MNYVGLSAMELYRPPPYNPQYGIENPGGQQPQNVVIREKRRAPKPTAPPPPYGGVVYVEHELNGNATGATAQEPISSRHRHRPMPKPRTLPRNSRPPDLLTEQSALQFSSTSVTSPTPAVRSSLNPNLSSADDEPVLRHRRVQSSVEVTRGQQYDNFSSAQRNAISSITEFEHSGGAHRHSRCNSLGRPSRRPRSQLQFDSVGRQRGRTIAAGLNDGSENNTPLTPPRRLPGEPISSPIRCLQKFQVYTDGQFSHSSTAPVLSVDVSQLGEILVVDSQSMHVHIFSARGELLHRPFRVVGVCNGCFVSDFNRLALATHRGLRLCDVNGLNERDLIIAGGRVVRTKPYGRGFVAVQPRCLLVYRGSNGSEPATKLAKRRRSGLFRYAKGFVDIADVSVTATSMLAVLDTGRGAVYVVDGTGLQLSKIVLSGESVKPICMAVDRKNNLFCSDSTGRRLLHYSPTGKFLSCLLNFSVQVSGVEVEGCPSLFSVVVSSRGQLVLALSGTGVAEVRIYQL